METPRGATNTGPAVNPTVGTLTITGSQLPIHAIAVAVVPAWARVGRCSELERSNEASRASNRMRLARIACSVDSSAASCGPSSSRTNIAAR